ncbi:MAG: hypothetical protein Q7T74_06335 [Candidatus Saccharibacteria bacterium]|nr:hypothetical protein [Candidatus Saccharibacteria bacterium]
MKNRSTSVVCGESVRNRCRILQETLQNPAQASSKVFEACLSQSALASMSLPSQGITALSRNSMYKYANLELIHEKIPNGCNSEGSVGYRYLEWLRNEVKRIGREKIFDRTKSAHASRADQRLQETIQHAHELRKHSLAVSKAYFHLFASIKGLYADESINTTTRNRIANMMNDHDRLYSELFDEVGTLRPGNLESL